MKNVVLTDPSHSISFCLQTNFLRVDSFLKLSFSALNSLCCTTLFPQLLSNSSTDQLVDNWNIHCTFPFMLIQNVAIVKFIQWKNVSWTMLSIDVCITLKLMHRFNDILETLIQGQPWTLNHSVWKANDQLLQFSSNLSQDGKCFHNTTCFLSQKH
jgi:hypothetical protein